MRARRNRGARPTIGRRGHGRLIQRDEPGRLRVGTSGFAYPAWTPRFYPPGTRSDGLLAYYASRLDACELNNTFYRRPTAERLAAWRVATPASFRFAVKAQKGASFRALGSDGDGPAASVAWLTEALPTLGDRLGTMLLRVPEPVTRDDARLARLLASWPPAIPLTLEFQDPSWHVDETFDALRTAGAVLCATDLDAAPPPDLRLTGSFLYLRLRRLAYGSADLASWADRVVPFLATGIDVYAFLRHDAAGEAVDRALALAGLVSRRLDDPRS
jgi:uncharacterized protein YecE (DUF72 family)